MTIIQLLFFTISFWCYSFVTGVLEGMYYYVRVKADPKIQAKLDIKPIFSTRVDKLTMVALRVFVGGLIVALINAYFDNLVLGLLFTILMFGFFPLIREAAYNLTRFMLGDDKYEEWIIYTSPTDTSFNEYTFQQRLGFAGVAMIMWFVFYFSQNMWV